MASDRSTTGLTKGSVEVTCLDCGQIFDTIEAWREHFMGSKTCRAVHVVPQVVSKKAGK